VIGADRSGDLVESMELVAPSESSQQLGQPHPNPTGSVAGGDSIDEPFQ
jgi:hypothetical protein